MLSIDRVCDRIKNTKRTGLSNPFFFFAAFLMAVVAMNGDLNSKGLIWWGTVAFFIFAWFLTCGMSLRIDERYSVWILGFAAFSAFSVVWADSPNYVMTAMKTMVVHLVILLLLRSSVQGMKDIDRLLYIIAGASLVNSFYLVLTSYLGVGFAGNSGIRLGTEDNWNANAVGMMAAVASLIFIYFLFKSKKIMRKLLYLALIASMMAVSLLSGSRKALLMIIGGTVVYLFLVFKNKRFRIILVSIAFLYVIYYVVMEVPYFYSIIGVRVKDFLALFTAEGEADNSTLVRQRLITIAIDAWKQSPIIGNGLDNARIYNVIAVGKDYYSHNNYVEILADLGIIGFALYYGGYANVSLKLLGRLKQGGNMCRLLFTLMGTVLVIEYACVTYNDILFKVLMLIIFAFVSLNADNKELTDLNA